MIYVLIFLFLNRCSRPSTDLPEFTHPKHWQQTSQSGSMDYKNFWYYFRSAAIDRLVKFALERNPDLKKAKHRILEARALYNSAQMNALLPQIGMQLTQGQNPMAFGPTKDLTVTQQQFDVSWELDIVGKKTKTSQAQSALLRLSELDYKAIEHVLIVDVVTTYVDIQLQRQLLKTTEHIIEICQDQVLLVSAKNRAGIETNHGEEEWRIQSAKNKQNCAQIQHNLTAAKNKLAVLLGSLPYEIEFLLSSSNTLPHLDTQLLLEKPVTILHNRPDVLAAEQAIYAAHYTKAAELSRLWPTVTLSSIMGREQVGQAGFSTISAFGFKIFQPLIDLLRIHKDAQAKKERVEQSKQNYIKTVLQAYEEIENALSAYQNQKRQWAESIKQEGIQKRLYQQSRALYKQGLNSKIDVNKEHILSLVAQQNQTVCCVGFIRAELQLIKAVGHP